MMFDPSETHRFRTSTERVLVDDRVPGYRGRLLLHPTWQVEYLPQNA